MNIETPPQCCNRFPEDWRQLPRPLQAYAVSSHGRVVRLTPVPRTGLPMEA